MASYLLTFIGGLAMILSFAGLGHIMALIFFNKKRFDFGLRIVFGVILFVIIGGYLNLLSLISKTTLLGFMGLGLLTTLYFFVKNIKIVKDKLSDGLAFVKNNKKFAILASVIILIILIRYACAVCFFSFHGSDDYHGYLVFPAKMIQTGSMGEDPFSERRIVSSLGGSYLLNSAVLSFASFKNLHLVDSGIGFVLLIILLCGLLKELKINKNISLLLIFLTALIPNPSGNVTCFLLAAALFFAVFRLLCFKNDLNEFQKNTAVAFIIATLVVLKTNLAVPAGIIFCCFFFLNFYRRDKKIILMNLAIAAAIFLITLLPWMISMFESCGTLFYPFLGRGYYGTGYGTYAGHFFTFDLYSFIRLGVELFVSLGLFLPLIILGYVSFKNKNENRRELLYILAGCLLGIAAIIYGVGAYALSYYTFSFVLPTVLILAISAINEDKNIFGNFGKYSICAIMVVVFMIGVYAQKAVIFEGVFEQNISFDNGVKIGLINSEIATAEELQQYKNMQYAVPAEEIILARMDRNFLLDFKRNNIYIIDMPGAVSLPPGMPYKEGSEKLADYLLSVGIKYVAYSYGNQANFTREVNSGMLRVHVNPWLKAETEHSFEYQDNLMELYKSRKAVFDDGKNFVLDLSIKK
jgi:hypothetical protein